MTVLYEQPERHIPMFSHLKDCARAGAMDHVSLFSNTAQITVCDAIARKNLDDYLRALYIHVDWYTMGENVGKAVGMNTIMNNAGEGEIWFHMDSDILISAATMRRAFELFDQYGTNGTRGGTFSILSLEQSGERCHKARHSKPAKIINGEHAVHLSNGQGVAGGAMLLLSSEARYKEGVAIYGGNEPSMYKSVRDIERKDFKVALCSTLVVAHPKDYNVEYTRWKRNVHATLRKKGEAPQTGYFD